ncbi:type IV pilus assembly protein PilM [Candidatus Uhrbacteria bacterium]|nr:type IV pilus assembly protein PilM [Candidatus Uhrbacteria bacterium]
MSYRNELAFGLDIGDRSLKVLQFRIRKHKTYLVAFGELTLPEGIIEKGEILRSDELAKQLQALLRKTHIVAKRVVLALPEAKSFITTLNVMGANPENVEEQIRLELSKLLPYELNEVWWDFRIVSTGATGLEVLVGAAPKTLIASYQNAVKQAGLIPFIFDLEPLCIVRSMINERQTPGCVAIVDLGATKSTIIVANQRTILTTADGRSPGNELNRAIAQRMNIELGAAEEMKYKYGARDGTEPYRAVVQTYLATLSERINSTISFILNRVHPGPAISEIILSGGGSLLTGLPEALTPLLRIPVKIGDPWTNTPEAIGIQIGVKAGIRFTTACGLALTGLTREHAI